MSNVFHGGVPTNPVVRTLMERYAEHGPGASVPYDEIVQIVQTPIGSTRFNTIVNSWRRALWRERNIATVRIPGTNAVRFLQDNERAIDAFHGFRSGVRKIGRAYVKASAIPVERLTPRERDSATHVRRVTEATLHSARGAAKELATRLDVPKTLPRSR